MITKSFNINLDINASTTKKTSIQLVSNDIDTYTFNISLYNGQALQDLSTVDHALIFFKRPNNTVIQDTITMSDAANGKLTYTFINNSSIQYSGTVNAEIEFYNADNTAIMTSSKFSFEVRESINNDGSVQASSEYPILTTLIQDVEAAETIRTSNENDRIASENTRVSNETTRESQELSRVNAENTRESNEITRIDAENNRFSAETTRESNENTRISNEITRTDAEDNRIIAESDRDSAESTRVSNESTRNSDETIRVDNEAIRVSNEDSRAIAETTRVNSENERISNEDARIIAETNRATAEDTRITNEDTRISNENTRISQEEARQTDTASAIDNLNAAVETTQVIPQIGVSTFTDIATTYPTPSVGWLVHVDDTGKWYRYDGSTWINTSTYSNEALDIVVTNEANRVDAENSRVTAEATRELNEDTRISNEATRISDEDTRISNENTRISNEDTRIAQETTRQTDTYNAINTLYTAVSNSQVIPLVGVATYGDIASTYPSPLLGWLVHVEDTSKWYRYDGSVWINTSTYSNEALDALVAQVNIMKKYLPNEINLLDQEDATQKIQTALDSKGHIILYITGTAFIDKLTIYSDTTLEIHGTLKLKDNVNDFMLENEHNASETERNKNITISGGTFDRNTENNTFSVPDEFGYGIFVAFGFNLRNIDNLKLYSNDFV